MGAESYCSKCVSCQGCNSCETCNACQLCNSKCNAPSGCNTLQAFCAVGCQAYGEYGGFAFSYSPTTGTGIMGPGYFDQDVWDEIISYINTLRSKGSVSRSGSNLSYSSVSDVAPFKASEFNRIANAVNGGTVSQNGVIYGSYFSNLESSAEAMLLNKSACDKCNVSCDVTCNACQKCNTGNTDACGTCQACQGGNTTTYCCGCNGGEAPPPK